MMLHISCSSDFEFLDDVVCPSFWSCLWAHTMATSQGPGPLSHHAIIVIITIIVIVTTVIFTTVIIITIIIIQCTNNLGTRNDVSSHPIYPQISNNEVYKTLQCTDKQTLEEKVRRCIKKSKNVEILFSSPAQGRSSHRSVCLSREREANFGGNPPQGEAEYITSSQISIIDQNSIKLSNFIQGVTLMLKFGKPRLAEATLTQIVLAQALIFLYSESFGV